MQIVIVGAGRVGNGVAAQLTKEGHNVTIIDGDPNRVRQASSTMDVMALEGNGVLIDVQRDAGVEGADLLIAATAADEINLLCCLAAKKLGAKHTIARVRTPEYARQIHFFKDEMDISLTINPELSAAHEISRVLRFPAATKVESFAKSKAEIVELKVAEKTPLDGLILSQLPSLSSHRVLICAVQRQGETQIPTGNFVLQPGDMITIVAPPDQITGFVKDTQCMRSPVHDVIIVGGGRIALYLARVLLASGMDVKIIERDKERCQELSLLLPHADIIYGDARDRDILQEERIEDADAFVGLSDSDNSNILLSTYAVMCGVDKVITKVQDNSFNGILERMDVECVIMPTSIAAQRILRFVRSIQNAEGSNVDYLYSIAEGQAEVLGFRVQEQAKCLNIRLRDLSLQPNVLIAAIIRNGAYLTPGGNDIIQVGDHVLVTTTRTGLRDLDDILA